MYKMNKIKPSTKQKLIFFERTSKSWSPLQPSKNWSPCSSQSSRDRTQVSASASSSLHVQCIIIALSNNTAAVYLVQRNKPSNSCCSHDPKWLGSCIKIVSLHLEIPRVQFHQLHIIWSIHISINFNISTKVNVVSKVITRDLLRSLSLFFLWRNYPCPTSMANACVKIPAPIVVLEGVYSASLGFVFLLGMMKLASWLLWALSCRLKDRTNIAVLFTTLLVTEIVSSPWKD